MRDLQPRVVRENVNERLLAGLLGKVLNRDQALSSNSGSGRTTANFIEPSRDFVVLIYVRVGGVVGIDE